MTAGHYDLAALDIPAEAATRASASVEAGAVTMLAVSGRWASGKDTIAALAMEGLGYPDARRLSVGRNVCAEGDRIIAAIRAAGEPVAAAKIAADDLGVPFVAADRAVDLLWSAVVEDGLDATTVRHAAVRPALEFFGSVRRQQDPFYWLRPVMQAAVTAAAEGQSCYITDVRTPEEVAWAKRLGFLLVRIDISEETQKRRLEQRDGISWRAAHTRSPLETALDNLRVFDLRIDNNDDCWPSVEMPAVATIVDFVRHRRERSTTIARPQQAAPPAADASA